MSIAEQMGAVLRNTSVSTNIKERLDYSCAVFDAAGGLVANAPHRITSYNVCYTKLLRVDEWYDRWFGALLSTGTVAHLAYARQLMLLPVATVGQAIATAALPTFARLVNEERQGELRALLEDTLRAALGLSIVGGAALAVLASYNFV